MNSTIKSADILAKLHEIEKKQVVYNIHYRRAGVGFIFYSPPEELPLSTTTRWGYPENWKEWLIVHKYYPTFEEAVEGEYERIGLGGQAPSSAD